MVALGGGSSRETRGSSAERSPSHVPCVSCFWAFQPAGLRDDLAEHYRGLEISDALLAAERDLLVARLDGDVEGVCRARRGFAAVAKSDVDPERRAFALESAAFLAGPCGADAERVFSALEEAMDERDERWRERLYASVARGRPRPRFGEAPRWPEVDAPSNAAAVVIGESEIVVTGETRIGGQVERIARDWLSSRFHDDGVGPAEALVPWHEGHQVAQLVEATGAEVVALGRALAAHTGGRWFGADEDGVFRFEILPDKLDYPTTRAHGGLALLADTHGLSAIVEPALAAQVDLAVGCGDSEGKMQAALHLAERGVDVYFPCDRFVGRIVGYDAPGTLLGSAPITTGDDGRARIGGRPLTLWRDETVIVERARNEGDLRYYDAPLRYFRSLARAFPMRIRSVRVDAAGQSARVVDSAYANNADVIAVRIATPEDAAPVIAWLAASSEHRAVLFHSASYPAGREVFERFPKQTTFGDPKPRFVR